MKLVIVGNHGGTNIGGSLLKAAVELGLEAQLIEARLAMQAPTWIRRFNWYLRGRRPTWLGRFSRDLLRKVSLMPPDYLIATGTAPCNYQVLKAIRAIGIESINYLTDDPFNPLHRASWFLRALPMYKYVFSPRRANIQDLRELGCSRVSYLPFGYDPTLFFPDTPVNYEEQCVLASDVMFAGGADRDRLPWITALIETNVRVALYGDYWNRFPQTRSLVRGHADAPTLRKATSMAKVNLCLVRRANRDGHVMRSFEIPAMGGCMLTEDTLEHRDIFGAEGEAVVYFRTIDEMIARLRWLLDHPDERQRLARAAHRLITGGRHTYRDRLVTMLDYAGAMHGQEIKSV